mmetsp:Transcript_24304/g.43224  ORF Transcript_24304/g.43224 Transcript_24304/m.43224 type:complete len:250 (+) Transcript_24304:46-795(+)
MTASPKFIFSHRSNGKDLYITDVRTGNTSTFPNSTNFAEACCWCRGPSGKLWFSGGGRQQSTVTRVTLIESHREYANIVQADLLNSRSRHGSIYHEKFVYVVGGCFNSQPLAECERYFPAEDRWESIAALPIPCWGMSLIIVNDALLAIGGLIDNIQKLNLKELRWEVLPVTLPLTSYFIPAFQHNSDIAFILGKAVYALDSEANTITLIKELPQTMNCVLGPCVYHEGTIYCSAIRSHATSLAIGPLV